MDQFGKPNIYYKYIYLRVIFITFFNFKKSYNTHIKIIFVFEKEML